MDSTRKLSCGRKVTTPARVLNSAKLQQVQQQLKTYLEQQGLRYSEQRWRIAQTILAASGHYSAQELVKGIVKDHPDIGVATVYRNIRLLCDAKILKETLVDSEGNVVYEPFVSEHHDHIVCVDCGEIFEFADDAIERRQDELMKERGFRQARHRHILYAHCNFQS